MIAARRMFRDWPLWLIAASLFGAVGARGQKLTPLKIPTGGKTGLTLLSPGTTGVSFSNALPYQRFRTNQMLLNGSGVAAGDVDGDGLCDVYFCALDGENVLYRNLGNWRFTNITAAAGVACPGMDATAAALADLDGDGDLDLVVNSLGHGTRIFLNNGRGQFTDLMRNAPLNAKKGGMSLALGDLNGDGWLDLYIANYRTSALMDMPNANFRLQKVGGKQVVSSLNGRPMTDPELANRYIVNEQGGITELGEPDIIYLNQGGTNWQPTSFTGGTFLDEDGRPLTGPPLDWGLMVMIRDLNQDGLPDIYVCNDFDSPDRFWINQGGFRFQLAPRLTFRKSTLFSMAMDVGDMNRDGWDDLFVLDMLSRDRIHRMTTAGDRRPFLNIPGQIDNRPEYMMNMLFLNRGDGTYAEIGQLSGVAASEWSWSTVFLDVDLDGWEDILVANGNERESRHMDVAAQLKALRTQQQLTRDQILDTRRLFPRYATPNVAFRNRGDLTFEDASAAWGFDLVGVSHGIALADLDNDGDLDVLVNNLNAAAAVYRNESSAPRIAVRLGGERPNAAGIGARITVRGGPMPQAQEIMAGGRYLSSDQAVRVFAAGQAKALEVEVRWPSGEVSTVKNVGPNQLCVIEEPRRAGGKAAAPASNTTNRPAPARALFENVSAILGHTHRDLPFNDFGRQPTLPNKLSQLGPGVSWCDLDNDGWDDLVIPSGGGGTLALFRSNQKGGFTAVKSSGLSEPVRQDQTTVLPIYTNGALAALLIGTSNYEDGAPAGASVRRFDLPRQVVEDLPISGPASSGPMAMADIDNDGDLDLFLGGRCLPGKYPAPAASRLLRHVNGAWQAEQGDEALFSSLGMVSGAVFTDIDSDGDPDLAVASDWGPIRILRNEGGRFTDATRELGLAGYQGWWNGVTAGDFDGDGRLDLAASNWGSNSPYQQHRREPLQAYYVDWDGDGTVEVVETHVDDALKKRVPQRGLNLLARALPFLQEQFGSYAQYAAASVSEVLGEHAAKASVVSANWLETTVFLNRGARLEAQPLPVEAQMAPAFGLSVGDLDGDGDDDLFLSQNFFATQPETPRYDAGVGLWLKNSGKGHFTAVPSRESGVAVYGEQRGCALADYDGDGRVDLVVTQNGASTHLYRNVSANPGLRVRLAGPPGNPSGIGAVVRWENTGPARELHLGAGYWSSDSPVVVVPRTSGTSNLTVRWPGGKVTSTTVPVGAPEVRVAF